MKKEKKSRVRVCALEISGMTKEQHDRWRCLSETVRDIVNCIWQTWLLWHVNNGSRGKQREYLKAYSAWKSSDPKTRGEAPERPVLAVPPACQASIYAAVSGEFADVNLRPVVLLINAIVGKISSRKSANGSLPGWVSILLCKESMPSTLRKNPIPFDKKNSGLVPPENGDDHWKLWVRVDRIEREGKKNATSTRDEVRLWSKGRKAGSAVATLRKIESGEYTFLGSNLVLHWKRLRRSTLVSRRCCGPCLRLRSVREPVSNRFVSRFRGSCDCPAGIVDPAAWVRTWPRNVARWRWNVSVGNGGIGSPDRQIADMVETVHCDRYGACSKRGKIL
jgi:hypothetical protein